MKAVLGLLLILVGFTLGWLVVTGKLPPSGTTSLAVPGVGGDTQTQSSPSTSKKTTGSPTPPTARQVGTKQSGGTVA